MTADDMNQKQSGQQRKELAAMMRVNRLIKMQAPHLKLVAASSVNDRTLQLGDLPVYFRQKADELRRFTPPAATAFDDAADVVEAILQARGLDMLNLTDAAVESGYSADYLGRLVRDGKIANVGRPNAPRIRRRDLPRKAPTVAETHQDRESRIMDEVVLSKSA